MGTSKLAASMEVLDALPYQAFLVDSEHTMLACNRALAQQFGVDRNRVVGAYCPKLIHDADEPFPGCPLEESALTGQWVEDELFDPRHDSWTKVMIYPTQTYTPDGHRIFLHLARDITANKRNQEETTRLNHELVRLMKMEAVSRLAAGIAHEFNNLLFIMQSSAEMLLLGIRKGRCVQKEAQQILEAIMRGAGLTSQLQAFGRFDSGEPRVLDINAVLEEVRELLLRTVGAGIQLAIISDPDLLPVEIDREQLEQVVMNLCSNARDAMPDGGTLTIEAANVEPGGGKKHALDPNRYVLISVSDNGIGMEPEVLEQIFDPLFSTKEPGRGIGLGLCVVENIVVSAGGHIAVDSRPGRGTSFEVYLRATAADRGRP